MKSENEMELTGTQPPVSESESEENEEVRHKKTAHTEKNRHSGQPKKHKKKKISQKERGQRSARVYGVLIMLTVVFVISISLAVGII
ncbi:MAG: hypothetical protein IJ644_05990 [Oscillospiraceae bacterium]|nr:hypothetical protein [Oscillospiraceae bacterium]